MIDLNLYIWNKAIIYDDKCVPALAYAESEQEARQLIIDEYKRKFGASIEKDYVKEYIEELINNISNSADIITGMSCAYFLEDSCE